MLKLNLKKEPYWLNLPSEVRVCVKPLTNAIMSAAQNTVTKEIIRMREVKSLPEDDSLKFGLSESLLIKAVARHSIIEWEGIMNADGLSTAPVNDQNVNDLMDIWFIAQDFWKQYTSSLALLEAEGKFSGVSSSGTSAVAPDTASAVMNKGCRAAKARKTQKQGNIANI